MQKISTLGQRLKEQIRSEQSQIEAQTQAVLQEHVSSLKELSSAALSTTQSVIQKQEDEINAMLKDAQRNLSKMLLIPILSSVAISLAMIVLAWLWLPNELFHSATTVKNMGDHGPYLVLIDPDWTTCTMKVLDKVEAKGKQEEKKYPCRQKL